MAPLLQQRCSCSLTLKTGMTELSTWTYWKALHFHASTKTFKCSSQQHQLPTKQHMNYSSVQH